MSDLQEKLIFMTDPLCSWCWGMVPELKILQHTFDGRLSFELRCAGLQVGAQQPLSIDHTRSLVQLWQQVAATTGQNFAYSLPEDTEFIYHSEVACRALEIARRLTGLEPFDHYYRLQKAFYVDCLNIGNPEVLFELLFDLGVSRQEFLESINSEEVVNNTRQGFEWCKGRAITALPTLFLDKGSGPELVCGGYATADVLIPDIKSRLVTH